MDVLDIFEDYDDNDDDAIGGVIEKYIYIQLYGVLNYWKSKPNKTYQLDK